MYRFKHTHTHTRQTRAHAHRKLYVIFFVHIFWRISFFVKNDLKFSKCWQITWNLFFKFSLSLFRPSRYYYCLTASLREGRRGEGRRREGNGVFRTSGPPCWTPSVFEEERITKSISSLTLVALRNASFPLPVETAAAHSIWKGLWKLFTWTNWFLWFITGAEDFPPKKSIFSNRSRDDRVPPPSVPFQYMAVQEHDSRSNK